MAGISNVISSLKRLNGKFNGPIYDHALTQLRESENGLSDADMKSLLTLITDVKYEKCRGGAFKDIIFCCIPNTTVSNDTVDIALLWMLSSVSNEYVLASKINAVLEWISGLLEFNLVDKKFVDDYYEMYYRLLSREPCQKAACKLIHMLTRPEDVYRARVERILLIHKQNGLKRYTAHLIELFKTFRPELVPESVNSYSREAAFSALIPGFRRSLETAHQRAQSLDQGLCESKTLTWTSSTTGKGKSNVLLIPSAMYIHLGSDIYREKRRKVIDFLDKESLSSYHLNCEIPTSILSLLLNEGGIHFLATHNYEIHARFSSVLYSCLFSGFLLNKKNVPYEERERFLKQLVLLEDYMQQGIPVVSRFLALYINSWNGMDHQKHIYRLLERITLASFAEFNDCILIHLQSLFLSGNAEEKLLIINSLTKLIFNMFVRWNKEIQKEHLFLGQINEWEVDFVGTIPKLVQTVSNFCELGLRVTPNNKLILQASLSFFEILADLESEARMKLTILPPSIFYWCLSSPDFSSLARACSLLLRYKEESENLSENAVTLMNKYSRDVWNCLINRKAFTKSGQGHIFVKHHMIKQLLSSDPDSAFSLEYHPTMLGLARHFKAMDVSADDVLPFEVLRDALSLSFSEFGEYLDVLKHKYSQYHSR